jgi:hypothetical protein
MSVISATAQGNRQCIDRSSSLGSDIESQTLQFALAVGPILTDLYPELEMNALAQQFI